MESENIIDMGSGSGSGEAHQVNSRWNPTKEQISMLENMYSQGIRTPTTEQIQQITTRLKAYGHIEGKNVFYWFQNHKARQRQKQKQENIAYFNRYLHKPHHHHHHQPLFALPCPNVVCGTYYLPQSDLGFCPQYPKVLLPASSFSRRTHVVPQECNSMMIQTNQETLPLFPLHPTGILQGRQTFTASSVYSLGSTNNSAEEYSIKDTNTTPSSCSSDETTTGVEDCCYDKPFFDFFSGQGDDQYSFERN